MAATLRSNFLHLSSFGNSAAAMYVDSQGWRRSDRGQQSYAEKVSLDRAKSDLDEKAWDCRDNNWDGYGALPVTKDCRRMALKFLEAMPWGWRSPEIGVEPDGQITLDWHRTCRRTLSVSVDPDGYLHYAAMLGLNKVNGREVFYGEIPERILNLIAQVNEA